MCERTQEAEWYPQSIVLAQRLAEHAAVRGVSEAHLADYIATLDCDFTAEDEAMMSALVAPGHPAVPGYNDPSYKIEGRPLG